jgi:hypothetical protein
VADCCAPASNAGNRAANMAATTKTFLIMSSSDYFSAVSNPES